jgi:hypothetical protein
MIYLQQDAYAMNVRISQIGEIFMFSNMAGITEPQFANRVKVNSEKSSGA